MSPKLIRNYVKYQNIHRTSKYFNFIFRETQHTPQLTPRQLDYQSSVIDTPKSSRSSTYSTYLPGTPVPRTPVTPDVNSPASSQSLLTPIMQSMMLVRGRGRP